MRFSLQFHVLLFLALSAFNHARAQNEIGAQTQNFSVKSPNAYAFSKISHSPMNPFTGQMEVSLPLYEKKLSELSLSLSLDYTTPEGIKADAPGTVVGKSWHLNVGGIITRNQRGVPDDFNNAPQFPDLPAITKYNGILYNDGINYKPDGEGRVSGGDDVRNCADGIGDAQHDIFEFNILGRSGKFYIGKDKTVLIVTDSKFKIIPNFSSTSTSQFELASFLAVDEFGIKYYFDKVEKGVSRNGYYTDITDIGKNTYHWKPFGASWLLTRIESPFNEEYIEFEYTERQDYTVAGISGSVASKRSDLPYWNISSGGGSVVKKQDITSITFSDNTKINFSYFSKYADGSGEIPLLKTIEVINSAPVPVKKYALIYSWWEGANQLFSHTNGDFWMSAAYIYKTHLHSVQEVSTEGQANAAYSFDYFLSADLNETTLGDNNCQDFWGYYNGKPGSLFQVEAPTITPGDRTPDLAYTRMGALKKIIHSTGGSETFDYELNKRRSGSGDVVIGGLRLLRHTLHDGIDIKNDIVKTYLYVEADGQSSGFLGEKPMFDQTYPVYNDNGGWPSNPSVNYTVSLYFTHPVNPLSTVEGGFVGYRRVEEVLGNGSSGNGKIVYEYSDLSYTQLWYSLDYFPYRPVDRPYWALGLPLITTYFASNSTTPVKQVINTYNIFQNTSISDNFRSMHAEKIGEIDVFGSGSNLLRFIYKFKNYYPVVGRAELASTKEYHYSSNDNAPGELLQSTTNTYDPTYYFLRSSSKANSKNQAVEKHFYYPVDYNMGPGSFTSMLAEKNILNKPVYEQTLITDYAVAQTHLSRSEAFEYAVFDGRLKPFVLYRSQLEKPVLLPSNSFDPSTLLQLNDNLKPEMYFNAYDGNGRLTEYSNAGSKKVAVVFDKGGNLLAKAENSSLRYFGFETNEFTNWVFDAGGVTSSDANSGSSSYKGAITISGITPEMNSLQFYMKGTGTVNAGGNTLAATSSWKRASIPLNAITSMVINTGNVLIDDIVLVNEKAPLALYAHKPEVGIIQETDANEVNIYYEYDEFNRLKSVKDHMGHIMKNYQYKYKLPFYNTPQSGTFSKDNCPAGQPIQVPGPPVTYTVQAGKYASHVSQATADAMALSDVHYNGQRYANDHGTCLIVYYNVAASLPFNKNDCPANTEPTTHYYYVEANKYSSTVSQNDANAKALAEIQANGQAYANSEGHCTVLINVSVYNGTPDKVEVSFGGLGKQFVCVPGQTTLQIPNGTYTVHMQPWASGNFSFGLGARSTVTGRSATFENVYIVEGGMENYMSAY